MDMLKVQYVKSFDKTRLLEYLREDNFADVADILKSRDTDGSQFLQLDELALMKWRLNPKQRKKVLDCKNAITARDSKPKPPMNTKPPIVAPRPSCYARINTNRSLISQDIMKRKPLPERPCSILKRNIPSNVASSCKYIEENEYMPMTAPLEPIKPASQIKICSALGNNKSNNNYGQQENYSNAEGKKRNVIYSNEVQNEDEEDMMPLLAGTPEKIVYDEDQYLAPDSPYSNSDVDNIYEAEPIVAPTYKPEPVPCSFKLNPHKPALNKKELPGYNWNTTDGSASSCLFRPPPLKVEEEHVKIASVLLNAEKPLPRFNPNDCRFYRNTDRKGAMSLLRRIPRLSDGTFLIRPSTEHAMVVTMYQNHRFYNVGMEIDEGGVYCKGNDEQCKKFRSLDEFIGYYERNPIVIKTRGECIEIFLRKLLPDDIF